MLRTAPLILVRSYLHFPPIMAQPMSQNQSWGVYGSHLETLNPSQFVHQLVVESRHHVFGDSDLNPIYKRRLYPNRILPSLSPIVISSLQAPSRRRTFFPMQHLSLTSLPVPSPITILSYLGVEKALPLPLALMHICSKFQPCINATIVTNLIHVSSQAPAILWTMILVVNGISLIMNY